MWDLYKKNNYIHCSNFLYNRQACRFFRNIYRAIDRVQQCSLGYHIRSRSNNLLIFPIILLLIKTYQFENLFLNYLQDLYKIFRFLDHNFSQLFFE